MPSRLKRLWRALERDDVRSISRRYFISNGFDGALTTGLEGLALAVGGDYLGWSSSNWGGVDATP